jgi:hypothetical protein
VFSNILRVRTGLAAIVLASALTLPGCTKTQLANNGSSYLIVDAVTAAAGPSTTFGGSLASDVETNGTRWRDNGRVVLRLGMVDPGSPETPAVPTSANYITITKYHVKYVRADGLAVQGVHVPFEFDGAATITVQSTDETITMPFVLVHADAKFESPLIELVDGGSISTVAEITLFGTDQAGRAVTVKGFITVVFANWG